MGRDRPAQRNFQQIIETIAADAKAARASSEQALQHCEAHRKASEQQHAALAQKVDAVDTRVASIESSLIGDLKKPEKKGLLTRMTDAEKAIAEMEPEVKKVVGHQRIFNVVAWAGGAITLAALAVVGEDLARWFKGRG